MLVIGGLLNVVGLGFFCWVLFTLAIDVAGFRWRHSGDQFNSSWSRAIRRRHGWFIAGSNTLVAGQLASSVAHSPIVRFVIGLLFALPAACPAMM
jgi:hypothetical protein